jgi:hypothetical protein
MSMTHYLPPKAAFDPRDLAVMRHAFDAAWTEIMSSNLIDGIKDDALRRAVCQKLFSLVRSRPADAETLRDLLLSSVSADSGDYPEPLR